MPPMPAQDSICRLVGCEREAQRCAERRINRPTESVGVITRTDNTTAEPFARQLQRLLSGQVCVLGVGNRYRRDDGAGSLVAERLVGRTGALSIDAGAVPENYLEKVARSHPDTILIVDAADFGGAPGHLRILDPEAVGSAGLSTHALSLQMTAEFLKSRTGARLAIVAIQPADIGLGTELSDEVSEAVRLLQETLCVALREHANGHRAPNGNCANP